MVVGTLADNETVSVMTILRKTLSRLISAAAVMAVLVGAASAQFPAPTFSLQNDKPKTPQQIEHDQAIDRAYRSATKKIPEKQTANDPWADVRSAPTPTAPEKKKQEASQNKKHAD
jgi:hypothetical protein